LPETELSFKKDATIKCKCCGYDDKINKKYVQNKAISKLVEMELKK